MISFILLMAPFDADKYIIAYVYPRIGENVLFLPYILPLPQNLQLGISPSEVDQTLKGRNCLFVGG